MAVYSPSELTIEDPHSKTSKPRVRFADDQFKCFCCKIKKAKHNCDSCNMMICLQCRMNNLTRFESQWILLARCPKCSSENKLPVLKYVIR